MLHNLCIFYCRVNNRASRFKSGYKRQLINKRKDLSKMRERFQSERFLRRVCLEKEFLDNTIDRLKSGSKRQVANRQKDLFTIKSRFQPDRFFRRIRLEKECLCDWGRRYLQRFKSEIHIRKQHISNLSGRFRLESILNFLRNEKSKLADRAATLRVADPATSLKRGFALVYSESGDLIKSLSQVRITDILSTEVSDGRILSTVKKTERKKDV